MCVKSGMFGFGHIGHGPSTRTRAAVPAPEASVCGGNISWVQRASVCNIAIHAVVMVAVIKVARIADEWATSRQTLRLITVMTAAVTVLMVAHLAEVLVWSLIYAIVSAAPAGTDLTL